MAEQDLHQSNSTLSTSQASQDNTQASTNPDVVDTPSNAAQTDHNKTSTAPESSAQLAMTSTRSTSPYGTRSRNRSSVTRVNYAEDKDNDMDFEYTNGVSTTLPPGTNSIQSATSTTATSSSSSSTTPVFMSTRSQQQTTSGPARRSSSIATAATMTNNVGAPAPSSTASTASRKRKTTAGTIPPAVSSTAVQTTTAVQTKSTTRHPDRVKERAKLKEELTNMVSFEKSHALTLNKQGGLEADNGIKLNVNDHIYLICEPPGEPYYLARIMEFLHSNNDPLLPIDSIRVNWYYRPKDIQRKAADTRVVFATMHSDPCPLSAIRGKCFIRHRAEIDDLDEYRKEKDSFYFDKMYDRYIHRYYEVIPTNLVLNVPAKVRRVLTERWRYVLVESGRAKELTSQMKECKRCTGYCATHDSVQCAVCGMTYHMNCVRPPLLKKPSRGFAWACGPCNRAQERKLEARNSAIHNSNDTTNEEDNVDDEDEELAQARIASAGTTAEGGEGTNTPTSVKSSSMVEDEHHPTPEQIAMAKLWPYRYLGIHCRVEDALDYDDRIYPRAASRLGPRHQANVLPWYGRPVEYVKPIEIKKRSHQKGDRARARREAAAGITEEKDSSATERGKWVQEMPSGYLNRGEDESTATLMFNIPEMTEEEKKRAKEFHTTRHSSHHHKSPEELEDLCDKFMEKASLVAKNNIGVESNATNFLDKATNLLFQNDFDMEAALKQLKLVDKKKDLKEPEFKGEELRRFEEGVGMFGSELHAVAKHVKTKKTAEVVRFYYMWKKTPRGKEIWGNYEGRKSKKEAKQRDKADAALTAKLVDDVADDHDDSAFDNDKAAEKKRAFECKFCGIKRSVQWRRAPGVSTGLTMSDTKSSQRNKNVVMALCRRCGELWRRYGIQWEDLEEVAKKLAQGNGRYWKRKIDEEMLRELQAANEEASKLEEKIAPLLPLVQPSVPNLVKETSSPQPKLTPTVDLEPLKKKAKVEPVEPIASSILKDQSKHKKKEKTVLPPPEPPKPKLLPCAVCQEVEPVGNQHLVCRDCKLTVHRGCYGVGEIRSANKWICDMCTNDKNPLVSTDYTCVLCPVRGEGEEEEDAYRLRAAERPYGYSSKSQSKDKEKEKIGNNLTSLSMEKDEKKRMEDKVRPVIPRQPLKQTAGNNWIHVTCAVWTNEIRFGNAKALLPAEGIGTIAQQKFSLSCTVCKTNTRGACIQCHACHAPVHVECARKAEWTLGFDVQPVKSTRRDLVTITTVGDETGNMQALVWCKNHDIKSIVHPMNEVVPNEGKTLQTALQLYVSQYKQADLTLTGTVRKAQLVTLSNKASQQSRRTSLVISNGNNHATTMGHHSGRGSVSSPSTISAKLESDVVNRDYASPSTTSSDSSKTCEQCHVTFSPVWHKILINSVKSPAEDEATSSISKAVMTNGTNYEETMDEKEDITTPVDDDDYSYLCHRCNWKKKEGKDEREESTRTRHSLTIGSFINTTVHMENIEPKRSFPTPEREKVLVQTHPPALPPHIPNQFGPSATSPLMVRNVPIMTTVAPLAPIAPPPSIGLPYMTSPRSHHEPVSHSHVHSHPPPISYHHNSPPPNRQHTHMHHAHGLPSVQRSPPPLHGRHPQLHHPHHQPPPPPSIPPGQPMYPQSSPPRYLDHAQSSSMAHPSRVYATPEPRPLAKGASGSPALANLLH